ncbi:acetamidase/formamidase family protein [Clostridium sp. CF012]|uniref:acetamidase/formamidase family protein n=1 Tax=Clostridium sp. CF012 TaxID=2843319 RepID=UPI001C0D7F90|nr:acetamidase/formamidase family protein [Clostridium sp. CF012]MBU3143890.1 acetamidase/formamidase family protein [Clostridium sp. CF012]
MKKINKEQSVFTLSKDHKPVASIISGETLIFETSDCFNNELISEAQSISDVKSEFINPATGPLYVQDAEIGDILKIEIIDIKIDDNGTMTVHSGEGLLGDVYKLDKIKIVPIKDNFAIFNELIKIPVNPMIGVIGVAPTDGEISTFIPGSHGGNMYCKRITKGAIVYLPVNVSGALLAMGDLHAIMGDGETGGCGLEVSGEVTVKVTVVKNKVLPLPIVITDHRLMTISTESTIDKASKQAVINMHQFLVSELKMDSHEVGLLISLLGDLRVCQIVNPLLTARMELPIDILEKYNYKMV